MIKWSKREVSSDWFAKLLTDYYDIVEQRYLLSEKDKYHGIHDTLKNYYFANGCPNHIPANDRITKVELTAFSTCLTISVTYSPRKHDIFGWLSRGRSIHHFYYKSGSSIAESPMNYLPDRGIALAKGHSITPSEYREIRPDTLWTWDPETGHRRSMRDILNDPFGHESWSKMSELKQMNKVLKDSIDILKQLVEDNAKKE